MNMATNIFSLAAVLMHYGSMIDTGRVEAVHSRDYSNVEGSSEILDILRNIQNRMEAVERKLESKLGKLDGLDTEIKLISRIVQKKKVDGRYTPWGAWGECSKSCGNGTISRTRSCSSPPPLNEGKECTGSTIDVSPCYNEPCKIIRLPIRINMNFSDAVAHCKKLGGSLLIANSPDEYRLGMQDIEDRANYYIGLKMEKGPWGTRKWEWIDGSPTSWLNFMPGYGYGSEDRDFCATMSKDEFYEDKWFDTRCSYEEYFICKIVNDVSKN